MVAGVSVKIVINYGRRTSIGIVNVNMCRKLWNILGLSRWYKDGLNNFSDITSQ